MATLRLPFFSRGELSPKMLGRVDTAAYSSGLKTARNVIVDVTGGVFNRPGTIYIAPTKYFDKYTRLIPFAFKVNDTHVLEFGDKYMRVIREDFPQLALDPKNITSVTKGTSTVIFATAHGYVDGVDVVFQDTLGMPELNNGRYKVAYVDPNVFRIVHPFTLLEVNSTTWGTFISGNVDSIYEIATPYNADDLKLLRFAQSADILTLVHNLYPIMELKRFALNDWRLEQVDFFSVDAFPTNIDVSVENSGSQKIDYQVTAVREDGSESLPGLPNTGGYQITGITNANPARVTVTPALALEEEDQVFIQNIVGMTDLNNRRFTIRNLTTDALDLVGEDSTLYEAFDSAVSDSLVPTFFRVTDSSDNTSTTDVTQNTITWTPVEGAVRYDVYKADNGVFGFMAETSKTSVIDKFIEPDLKATPPTETDPFRNIDDFPGAVGFYQQRRVFGGSNNRPDTYLASQPGDYSNFTRSNPTQDDDSITATLASGQVNQIKHFVTTNILGAFTSGNEWTISAGQEAVFSPFTAKADPNTNWGCAEHRPFVIGSTIVFVQEDNRTVRSFAFDNVNNTFKSSDLAVMSRHIFDNDEIFDWTLARTPYSCMVLTRTDGQAATMVFNEEQNVVGWTRWDTKGRFETVTALRVCLEPSTPEPDDGVYFVVARNINGINVKMIERLHNRRFRDVRDAFFVDCGRSYDKPKKIVNVSLSTFPGPLDQDTIVFNVPSHGLETDMVVEITDIVWKGSIDTVGNETQPDQFNDHQYIVVHVGEDEFTLKPLGIGTTEVHSYDFPDGYQPYITGGVVRPCTNVVYGMEHLEGETVAILADGASVPGKIVTDGRLVLPGFASRIHVGLPYVSDVETLNLEVGSAGGTLQAKYKRVNKVTVRFDKSREMLIGPNNQQLTPMKRPQFVEQSAQLFTGDREVIIQGSWNSNGRILFRMIDPLPFNILAVFPDIEVTT